MLTLFVGALLAQAPRVEAPVYVPSQTRVLILPPLNASGDKAVDMMRRQVEEARGTLRSRFEERGFAVVPDAEAEAAVRSSGVDLGDEENRRKEPLYKMGEAANARLVVFTVVEHTSQRQNQGFLTTKLEGSATLKTWLLDVKDRTAILSGVQSEGRSSKNGMSGIDRQVKAVRMALDQQLKEFLKPYPEVKR